MFKSYSKLFSALLLLFSIIILTNCYFYNEEAQQVTTSPSAGFSIFNDIPSILDIIEKQKQKIIEQQHNGEIGLSESVSAGCDFQALNQTIREYIKFKARTLLNTTSFDHNAFFGRFSEFVTPVLACFPIIGSMATFKEVQRPFFSDNCFHKKNTTEFDRDPCCNQRLRDSQCCAPRITTVKLQRISGFNDGVIDSKCVGGINKLKLKLFLANLQRKYEKQFELCEIGLKRNLVEFGDTVFKVLRCFFRVFVTPKRCTSHNDCFSKACDPVNNQCINGGLDNTDGVLQCVGDAVPPYVIRLMRQKFGLNRTSSMQELRQKFRDSITRKLCVENLQLRPEFTTKETCEAETLCTDGTANNCSSSNAFCGGECNILTGVCTKDFTAFLPNKDACGTYGICVDQNFNLTDIVTKPQCENGVRKGCSNYMGCRALGAGNCNQQSCEALGFCVGFPVDFDGCYFNFTYNDNGESACEKNGDRKFDIGCLRTSVNSSDTCKAEGGEWIPVPKTKEACDSFLKCQEGFEWTKKNAQDCTKCGGLIQKLFLWQPAQWKDATFINAFYWTNRTTVSKRHWITAITETELLKYILLVANANAIPKFVSFLSCAVDPLLRRITQFSCVCGDVKGPPGFDCFPKFNPRSVVGIFRAFSKLAARHRFLDAEIKVSESTVSDSTDSENINIEKQDEDFSEALETSDTDTVAISETTIKIVSDGISVQGDLNGPVELCINKDQEIEVPSTHKTPLFAKKDSEGNVIDSGVTITNPSDSTYRLCGNVVDNNVYYAAYKGEIAIASPSPGTSSNNSTKPGNSNPSSSSISFYQFGLLNVLLLIISSVLLM